MLVIGPLTIPERVGCVPEDKRIQPGFFAALMGTFGLGAESKAIPTVPSPDGERPTESLVSKGELRL